MAYHRWHLLAWIGAFLGHRPSCPNKQSFSSLTEGVQPFPSVPGDFCRCPHRPAVVSASVIGQHTSHFRSRADLGVIESDSWLLVTNIWAPGKARARPKVQSDIGTKHGRFYFQTGNFN